MMSRKGLLMNERGKGRPRRVRIGGCVKVAVLLSPPLSRRTVVRGYAAATLARSISKRGENSRAGNVGNSPKLGEQPLGFVQQ